MRTRALALSSLLLLSACDGLMAPVGGPDLVEPGTDGRVVGGWEQEDVVTGDDLLAVYEEDGGWRVGPAMPTEVGATRVVVLLTLRPSAGGLEPELQARGLSADGAEGDWIPVDLDFSEEVFRSGFADLGFEAAAVQLRIAADHAAEVVTLEWSEANPGLLLDVEPEPEGEYDRQAIPLTGDLAAIGVVPRAAWGAPSGAPCTRQSAKTRMAIHHTAGAASNGAAGIRAIRSYHMGKGYCDIAYHFLITPDGTIYEGRPLDHMGAHVLGHNSNNLGISLLGCYQPGACNGINAASGSPVHPADALLRSASRLISVLARRYGVAIDRAHIKGHREFKPNNSGTTCPGDNLVTRIDGVLSGARGTPSPSAPPPPPPPAVGCAEVDRIAGSTRYHTAALFSRERFPDGARAVVVAAGPDLARDALVAAPLARHLRGPLLLTARDALPYEVVKELRRLSPDRAVIVGGTAAVSRAVEDALRAKVGRVDRIAGSDRFDTAARVAREMGSPYGIAFVAASSDAHLVDALSASAAAAALSAPLLFAEGGSLPAATADVLADLGVRRTVAVGGTSAISRAVLDRLPGGLRLAGRDRFATAAKVAAFARDKGVSPVHAYVTRGDKMVDALPVAASARLLLLSSTDRLSGPAATFLRDHSTRATLIGGTGALSGAVESDACEVVRHRPKAEPAPTTCGGVSRLAGPDRYATAAAVSKRLFPSGAPVVVVVTGASASPDAVAAGPLARKLGGPVLLTDPGVLPGATSAEIDRLGARKAVIVGGSGAVSRAVADALRAKGLSVERISGADRFATNAKVARRVGAAGGLVLVASGEDGHLIDALIAGGPAAALGAPVLLVTRTSVPGAVADALGAIGARRAVIVGGSGAVSGTVADTLRAAGLTVRRLSGSDRFASAAAVGSWAVDRGVDPSLAFLVKGDGLLDGVSAGAGGRVVLLTDGAQLSPAAAHFLALHGKRVALVGGTGALSRAVASGACGALLW